MFGKRLFKYITERKIVIPSPYSSNVRNGGISAAAGGGGGNRSFLFKKWYELDMIEKQRFIKRFVDNYKVQYPSSKTNVSLKGLSVGMDEHHDSPSVFGIFYDDIWTIVNKTGKSTGRFGHNSFHKLLIKKRNL